MVQPPNEASRVCRRGRISQSQIPRSDRASSGKVVVQLSLRTLLGLLDSDGVAAFPAPGVARICMRQRSVGARDEVVAIAKGWVRARGFACDGPRVSNVVARTLENGPSSREFQVISTKL